MAETLTCSETMRRLRLTRAVVLEMVRSGELRGFIRDGRAGRRTVRILRASVDELLNLRRSQNDGPTRER